MVIRLRMQKIFLFICFVYFKQLQRSFADNGVQLK